MSKVTDMALARQVCKKLNGISVANSHLVAMPDPKLMASSIATAAVAKSKVGVGANSGSKAYVMQLGKDVLASKTARCDQFAAAVCYLLNQEPAFFSSIELLGNGKFGQGTHCWVVCGRDQAGNINNLGSWGANAFTIDVWAAKIHAEAPVEPDPANNQWNIQQAAQNKIVLLTQWVVN